MKTIKISNGEIRNGYEFNDFDDDIKNKIIGDCIQFEIEIMNENSDFYSDVLEMEKMRTPWFLPEVLYERHKDYFIEIIEINEYLFDDEGRILPVTAHTKGNKVIRHTYGKKEIECTIE